MIVHVSNVVHKVSGRIDFKYVISGLLPESRDCEALNLQIRRWKY